MKVDGWDVAALIGVVSLSAGVWIVAGVGWALIAFGAQVVTVSVILPLFAPRRSAK